MSNAEYTGQLDDISARAVREATKSVNLLYEQSGLQDLHIGTYQAVKLTDLDQIEQFGEFSRLQSYCEQYGLDEHTFATYCNALTVQKWETTSGRFYQVTELERVRVELRQEHAQYVERYLALLQKIRSELPTQDIPRTGITLDSSVLFEAVKTAQSAAEHHTDTCVKTDAKTESTLQRTEQYKGLHAFAEHPFVTLLCDTNILLDETSMRWLLALYRSGAHFEWYISGSIIRELLHVLGQWYSHHLIFKKQPKQQYEKFNEELRDIAEHMAFLAPLPKKDKVLARSTFLGSDPTDLHLHHAAIANDIEVLVTNDLRLFARVTQEQRKQIPYRVWTADQCLAQLAQDNMEHMAQALTYLQEQYTKFDASDGKCHQISTTIQLPYFHSRLSTVLKLNHGSGQQSDKQVSSPHDGSSYAEEYICPLCHETHQRIFSSGAARENFIRIVQALYELYPQLCNPQAQPFLKICYLSSTSIIRNPQGKHLQYHAKIGTTGIIVHTFDSEEVGYLLVDRLHDICPNCRLDPKQFVEQFEDVEYAYASQWQHKEKPYMSNTDYLANERNRIATYLTAYGIDVREGDASFAYIPDFVCEQEGVVVYIDSCLWHSKEYAGACKFRFHSYSLEHWQEEHVQARQAELDFRQQLRELGWRVVQIPHCAVLEKHRNPSYFRLFEYIVGESFTQDVLLRPAQRVFALEQRVQQLEAENIALMERLQECESQAT